MFSRYHGWCLFGLALLLAGCKEKPTSGVPPALDETHVRVVQHSNKLAWQLFDELREKPGNIVLSPYGVSASLAMLLAGADGRTREEVLAVLAIAAKDEHQFHVAHGDLLRWLAPADETSADRLDLATAIFVQTDDELLIPFAKIIDMHYRSEPHAVDFISQPATARKIINDWAAEKTRDKIREVVSPDEVSPQSRLVLANAVYFKGSWQHAFKKSATEPAPFHLSADKTIDVEMMHKNEEFAYAHEDGVRVLIMPYRGDQLSMALILPDEKDGLAALEKRVDSAVLSRWLAAAAKNTMDLPVWIPRFKFESSHDLEAALKRLGMLTAFDPTAADLSRIDGVRPTPANAGDRLFVDRIRQRAMIDVNEEGTKAAAVTSTTTETSKGPRDPPSFRADHPFLFLIRENSTGLILFLGRVVDPSQG